MSHKLTSCSKTVFRTAAGRSTYEKGLQLICTNWFPNCYKTGFQTSVKHISSRDKIIIRFFGIIIILCGLSIFYLLSNNLYDVKFTSKLTNIKEKVQEVKTKTRLAIKTDKLASNNIQILKSCSDICNFSQKSHNTLLVLVTTYIGNFDQRLAIRQTWGNKSGRRFKIAFLVGEMSYAQALLEFEERMYHDIVQGSFEDKYENLVLKTIMGYEWIVEICTNVSYVFFVDDDQLVNIEKLLDAIELEDTFKSKKTMYGNRLQFARPFRDKANKWYVSYDEYNGIFYPPYLFGIAILTHINVIEEFYIAFPYVKHFNIEDVYLGILAKLLDIPLVHDGRFSYYYIAPDQMTNYYTSNGYGDRGSLVKGWRILNTFKNK